MGRDQSDNRPERCRGVCTIWATTSPIETSASPFPFSIVHHPEEKPKKISLGVVKKRYPGMFEHSAHTEKGSSGAPICIPKENMNIVGIHLEGDKSGSVNKALKIEEIWPKSTIIQRLLP